MSIILPTSPVSVFIIINVLILVICDHEDRHSIKVTWSRFKDDSFRELGGCNIFSYQRFSMRDDCLHGHSVFCQSQNSIVFLHMRDFCVVFFFCGPLAVTDPQSSGSCWYNIRIYRLGQKKERSCFCAQSLLTVVVYITSTIISKAFQLIGLCIYISDNMFFYIVKLTNSPKLFLIVSFCYNKNTVCALNVQQVLQIGHMTP